MTTQYEQYYLPAYQDAIIRQALADLCYTPAASEVAVFNINNSLGKFLGLGRGLAYRGHLETLAEFVELSLASFTNG